ncbi:hypothetical protein [Salinicoccus roseus]|uniref:hypothetical protein n=1 Tax=Salinicoccus roseus TaxID=45670 RepID=UPI0035684D42
MVRHHKHDAFVAGSYFVTEAQTIVSRRMDPNDSVVVSITDSMRLEALMSYRIKSCYVELFAIWTKIMKSLHTKQ